MAIGERLVQRNVEKLDGSYGSKAQTKTETKTETAAHIPHRFQPLPIPHSFRTAHKPARMLLLSPAQ